MSTKELNRLPRTASVEEVMARIRDDGYCIIEDLAGNALMDKIAAEMDPWIDRTCYGRDQLNGFCTRRTGALIARSTYARKLVTDPLVLGCVEQWLSHAFSFQLNQAQILSVGPGARSQPVHVDEVAWDFYEFPGDYHIQCNTIWAMTDFTEENGATRIVPGSHKLPLGLKYKFEDTVPVVMKRGDAFIYSGKLYHGAGPNTTEDFVRKGINITYSVGWVKQEENQFLSVPMEIAKTLPDDLLRLMGYQLGAPGIGIYRDSEDPIAAVRSVPYEQYHYAQSVKKSSAAKSTSYKDDFLKEIEELTADSEQRS
ncbi:MULTISPECIES: phytanoyl-CoA dioxygenase family protein [Caballeronia]|uniref:phytanoyl-CoA dioxygenase family protein n=1 Tax=Caballeronia TaxID=1827195 RepID=UPI001FD2CF42|nr:MULTISPECIES: phytanoyl-CoA dioxygenase family protein [Caballeronia]MDR5799111.1 phytanoyl-CoA dioxygenase family protein [Caballeronia sp. LZ001]